MKVLSFDIGLRNLAVCKLDVNPETKTFSVGLWQVYSAIPDDLNVNKTPIEDLCPYFSNEVLKHLDTWLDDIDVCYIESQPMGRTRNLKTKVLSHILQVFLLSKRKVPIQFIHPTLKLKNMVGERNYRANKKFAIQETERLLEGTPFVDLFVGKKRDDLADCFLQGYYACWTKPKQETIVVKKNASKRKEEIKNDVRLHKRPRKGNSVSQGTASGSQPHSESADI
jgi:hypothetical protein